jgi:hypothetical protein
MPSVQGAIAAIADQQTTCFVIRGKQLPGISLTDFQPDIARQIRSGKNKTQGGDTFSQVDWQ